jgi:hypothetical protein
MKALVEAYPPKMYMYMFLAMSARLIGPGSAFECREPGKVQVGQHVVVILSFVISTYQVAAVTLIRSRRKGFFHYGT